MYYVRAGDGRKYNSLERVGGMGREQCGVAVRRANSIHTMRKCEKPGVTKSMTYVESNSGSLCSMSFAYPATTREIVQPFEKVQKPKPQAMTFRQGRQNSRQQGILRPQQLRSIVKQLRLQPKQPRIMLRLR